MRKPYTYFVANLTGCAIGISDFHLSCCVCAASESEAESWGLHVAALYAERFGLPPHNIKLKRDEVARSGSLVVHQDYDYDAPGDVDANDIREDGQLCCNAGELPPELAG